MFTLRLLGGLLLIVAALSLIHDGSQTLAGDRGILITPLGQHWHDISPGTMIALRDAVRGASTWIWDGPITMLLGYPAWFTFGILGALIAYAGRNKKRINIFAN